MTFDFNGGYNRNNFINFLRTDLFRNKFVQQQIPVKPERKTAFFVENGIFQLGTIQLGEEEIFVFEIKQSSKNDPRVTLTQDTFKLMGDLGIDNAIVALYVDDKSSWRFSLLTTKYEDFKKTTSNPKRFSFILGPNEKIRTVNQQLIKKGEIKDFEDLVSRFDVEVVRQEFFETYLELFVRLYKEILKDKPFADLLSSQNVDLVSFTKNLLGKIIFLYFIQQKGWLGLGKNTTTKYGEGNKDFMRKLWINFKDQGESLCTHEKTSYFYNDYLEWLFFAGLNVDRRKNDDRFEQLQMKVPYLNGGLFKEEYDGWKTNISKISNNIFSNKDEDGILDIFDRYNFTVDEDSLYDTDIAVDPEMLGRIFEKMISISSENIDDVLDIYDKKKANTKFDFGKDLNKKLGAFYTPREIVHYMTKESLIAYLQSKTKVSEDNIRILFDLKEKFLLNSADMKKAEYSTEKLMEIGNSIKDIDEALKSVKILDPAVGSGAFPMGLLHEISSLRFYMYKVFDKILKDDINSFLTKNNDISLYKIKKDIILNNIYGIDIDPGAIDIAKLRFRLSLVVDEQEPEPLPNFEFKFVCANSLIPLDNSIQEKDLFSTYDEPKLETLKAYKRKFYNEDSHEEKEKLKENIRSYTKVEGTLFSEPTLRAKQMEEFGKNFDNPKHSNSFFDAGLMLSESRGFDIVIGNPPYIQLQKNIETDSSKPKKLLGSLYEPFNFKTFEKRGDIYCLFYEKGVSLLKNGGICTYITSNKWMRAGYGESLRSFFASNTNPLFLIDLGPGVFDTATVDSNILILQKKVVSKYCLRGITLSGNNKISLNDIHKNGSIINNLSGDNRIISSGIENAIKENLDKKGKVLKDRDIEINFGIKSGFNDAFILTEDDRSKILNNCKSEEERKKTSLLIKPILRGKDIIKYGYEWKDLYIICAYYGSYKILEKEYPAIYAHLLGFKDKLQARGQVQYTSSGKGKVGGDYPGQHHRLELDNNPSIEKLQQLYKEKIVYGEIVREPQFYLDENGSFFSEATTFFITGEHLKYLYGMLHSKLISYGFKAFYAGGGLGSSGFRYKKAFLEKLPILYPDEEIENRILKYVNQIIDIKNKDMNADISDLQAKMDREIYDIYGLTDEEIQIIEDNFK